MIFTLTSFSAILILLRNEFLFYVSTKTKKERKRLLEPVLSYMDNPKRSLNAKAVAKEVIETVRKGEKVNLQKIQTKHGYSKKSAKSMKATTTKSFKEAIDPVVKAMQTERDAVLKSLKSKRSKAKYRDLIDGLDKLTKNIQLLGGKETGNQKVTFGWDYDGTDD